QQSNQLFPARLKIQRRNFHELAFACFSSLKAVLALPRQPPGSRQAAFGPNRPLGTDLQNFRVRSFSLESIDEAREKDAVETCLSSLVCQGEITLADAQSEIWRDWRKAAARCSQ
ncbi:MAG: hypothetical protein FWD08_05885, partial [Alphaproteobacteria bacterium]|nr:hypothetical protein [Alphaproteobacteria bacterium]